MKKYLLFHPHITTIQSLKERILKTFLKLPTFFNVYNVYISLLLSFFLIHFSFNNNAYNFTMKFYFYAPF